MGIDGRYEVWVKQVGSGAIPLLTLHGGPGFPHYFFECFEDFLPRDRIRFWYYDQLGCGFSDRPDDPSLWTVKRSASRALVEGDRLVAERVDASDGWWEGGYWL